MYRGEVNVSQAEASDLLKCAEILQTRAFCGSDAAFPLNQMTSATKSPPAVTALSSSSSGNISPLQAVPVSLIQALFNVRVLVIIWTVHHHLLTVQAQAATALLVIIMTVADRSAKLIKIIPIPRFNAIHKPRMYKQ